ncbi:MAG: outer membrane beta-barrel protein [Acidobacteria bacterium]|nr:outer membrane beta-barrel protein [Acidobacteriota bacterium]
MKKLIPTAALFFFAGVLSAQMAEVSVSGGASALSNKVLGSASGTTAGGDDISLDNGFRLAFRFTLNPNKFFGHEIGYAYSRTTLKFQNSPSSDAGMAIHQGFYNFLVYATPEGSRIRPFATGGVHFSNFVPPGYSVTSGQGTNKMGFNYGGGVKLKLTDLFGFRVDLRQYQTGKPFDLGGGGLLRQTEISAGLSIRL